MTNERLLMDSPVGVLMLTSDSHALTDVSFRRPLGAPIGDLTDAPADDHVLREARRQLAAYFEGQLRGFDLPLSPQGTPFQQRVWEELCRIPFGATASYGDIAARLGLPPGASRAVGLANGANPLPIVIPCHRVIGSDGTLVGYGGGLQRKRILLALEAPTVQDVLFRV